MGAFGAIFECHLKKHENGYKKHGDRPWPPGWGLGCRPKAFTRLRKNQVLFWGAHTKNSPNGKEIWDNSAQGQNN